MTAAPNAPADRKRGLSRTRIGIVTSDKREKTRTVMVEFQVMHRKYGKYLKRRHKIHVHDPGNTSKVGDRVEIVSCRPLSKTKAWRLLRVLKSEAVLAL